MPISKVNYELAFSPVFPLAEAGNVTAQCHIASIYEGGLGVPIDEQEVVKWYRKAAEPRIGREKYPELLITTSQRSSLPVCRGYLQILRLQRNTGVRL
jgi:TPR repeat protein